MALYRLNREEKRWFHNQKKEKIIEKIPQIYLESYNDGVRDSFMSLLLKLHDEFDFDNERTFKLLKACEPWMQACMTGEEDIDSEGIKKQLVEEGIVCLLNTDL